MPKLKENSVAVMVTILGHERPSKRGSIPGRDKRFPPPASCTDRLWAHPFSPIMGSAALPRRIQRSENKADHFSPCKAEFKVSGSTPSLRHTPLWRAQQLNSPPLTTLRLTSPLCL